MPEQVIKTEQSTEIPTTIEEFAPALQYIIRQVEENRNQMNPELARKIVTDSGVTEDDLMAWADFDHPKEDSYGRKLIYNNQFFEIMAMSWVPGDFSAIHDHGYTLWGAVKVFGPAEHSAFMVSDGMISTVARERFEPGRVVAVGHELVHQLGNPEKEKRFLSLHMYGLYDPEYSLASVTCDARVYDLTRKEIQRSDGGMFFDLQGDQVKAVEKCPEPDFLSWCRNTTEYIRRLKVMENPERGNIYRELTEKVFDSRNYEWFEKDLYRFVDENGHVTQPHYWNLLRHELKELADLQIRVLGRIGENDNFHTYAELYDEVIGRPCLNDFIASYLDFVESEYSLSFKKSSILSIGCGTGIMEEYMLDHFGLEKDQILGIDISEAMVREANRRIYAKKMDILEMDTSVKYDITYEGLNVFQYLIKPGLEKAILQAARLTKTGGYFIGDFVTPDHMRWYPHVIRSENVISLRMPRLVEKDHNIHQESEIINVSKLEGSFRVTYEGRHLRYMPSIWKIRYLFKKVFKGPVDIYDAVTLEKLRTRDDTSPSTRYLVVARKDW